ncbi:MAG: hypothetical protein V4603_12775, partial [Pseudomonadota bacterium]
MRVCCLLWLWLFAVSVVHAQNLSAETDFLDVSIQVFTHREPPAVVAPTAAPTSATREPVEAVRLAETRYLPMYLRYRLEQSGSFGAVRVLPIIDNGAELRVSGEVVRSNGDLLELAIKAQDSTGRVWLDRVFTGTAVASESLNDDALAEDPFAQLFADIVRELQQQATQLTPQEIERIKAVALLRYGFALVPAAFTPYLEESADGIVNLKRLPASDDPILTRILNIREREYLFVDVVDEEYRQFYDNVKPVYDLWRQYQREQTDSSAARTVRDLNAPSDFARGSYRA